MKKPLWHPSRLLLLLLFLIAGGTIAYVFLQVRTDVVKDTLLSGQNLVVDVIVADDERPLFNEILFYNPQSHKTAFLDVPPTTGGLLSSLGRVDALSALFQPSHMKPYLDEIGSLLGQNVPFYLLLNISDLEKDVDLLSGIDLFVSTALEATQTDPMFLLPSGNNLLDGTKTKEFLIAPRDGDDAADKASRFQRFVQAWLRKLGESKSFLTRSEVFPYFWRGVRTNMEDIGLKSFLGVCAAADWERTTLQRVLGTDRLVDGKQLLFPHYNGSLLKDTVQQLLEALPHQDPEALLPSSVSVEILNGTKLPGLASRTSLLLRSFGYNVLGTKNADNTNLDNTVVIDRRDNPDAAKKIADIIQCKKVIQPQGDMTVDADVIIMLGKDFDGRYVR